jgi:hypothetical protein
MMTQLEITTSIALSGNETSSIVPGRNSTLLGGTASGQGQHVVCHVQAARRVRSGRRGERR